MKDISISLEDRSNAISKILQLRKIVEHILIDTEDAPDDASLQEHLTKETEKALEELQILEDEYTAILPRLALSRCPFSNEIFSLSIDTFGVDGPWWDAEKPIRLIEEEGKTFFALTGSVNIIGEIPNISFPIKPGPAVPWVSPRLLENENCIAVLSHIKIGLYDAFVCVYYSKDKTLEIERINTWGTDMYIAEDIDGLAVTSSTYDEEDEYDFDIASWIKKGKLKWIAFNDANLELQDLVTNCPFVGLSGYQYPVQIYNGIMENSMISIEYDDAIDNDEVGINSKFCANCGTPVIKGSKFCANCGNKLN